MHDKLLREDVPQDYYICLGGHSWTYLLRNIKYQFMFSMIVLVKL